MISTKTKTVASITAVIAVTILFHTLGWLRPIERSVRVATNAGSEMMYRMSTRANRVALSFDANKERIAALEQEVRTLEEKYAVCRTEEESIAEERNELRTQMAFATTTPYHFVGADVIGKNIEPLGNNIIINQGTRQGIRAQQPVIVNSGILIGKIARVEDETAVVRLLTDPTSKVGATIVNRAKSLGLVEGGFGLTVQMNFIPQNETVSIGDTIVTSGLESGVPRGLLIGTVEIVQKETYQPFQQAVITPATSLSGIRFVSVITSGT